MGTCRVGQIKNPFGEGCLPDVTHNINQKTKRDKTKGQRKSASKNKAEGQFKKCAPKPGFLVWNNPFTKNCDQVFLGAKRFVEKNNQGKTEKKLSSPLTDIQLKDRPMVLKQVGSGKFYQHKDTDAAAIYKKKRTLTLSMDRDRGGNPPLVRTKSAPVKLGGSRR